MLAGLKRISAALGLLVAGVSAPAVAQTAAPANPNQATADGVARALRGHSSLSGYRIEILTRDGLATLSGTVATPAQKADAIALAGQVAGVSGVVDQLKVGDAGVRRAQYEPRVAMGGLFHRNRGGAGGPVMGDGEMVGSAPAAGQMTDGPLPEGVAGQPGATAAVPTGAPNYAWPSYAPQGNFSAVGYPTAYPWQAWPNIGPFYPYPEVPLDWRAVTLRWDDGIWWLDFRKNYTRPFFTPYPFGIFGY